jgi:phage RecT family recombinase
MQLKTYLLDAGIDKIITAQNLPVFLEAANQIMFRPELVEVVQTDRGAKSIVGAIMKAAIFGFRLTPELGRCHVLPRNIKVKDGKYEKLASFQIGYKGWQKLAFEGGNVQAFDFGKVCENDRFEWVKGTRPDLVHEPAKSNRGQMTHFWASCTLNSGLVVFDVIDIEEAEKYRRYSETQNTWADGRKQFAQQATGIWAQSYETMALRLPIRNICTKKIQISDRISEGIEADGIVSIHGEETYTPHQVIEKSEPVDQSAALPEHMQDIANKLAKMGADELIAAFGEMEKEGKMTDQVKALFTARKNQIHAKR